MQQKLEANATFEAYWKDSKIRIKLLVVAYVPFLPHQEIKQSKSRGLK